eukprot:5077189-Alexandrium_andersonii.AAC.1
MLRRQGEARTRLGLQQQLRLTGPQGRVHGALSRALSGLGFSAEGWGSWRSAQGIALAIGQSNEAYEQGLRE